jgi:sugar lactone lactonase YvrE
VVGYDEKDEANYHYGTVLMRALDGGWWVLDYGPSSRFSSFCLSRNQDILAVCERTKGEIATWDLVRQVPIGTIPRSVAANAEAESNNLLRDGSYVVAEVPAEGAAGAPTGSRLVHIDPMTTNTVTLAEGFDRIGAVMLNPESGSLYVSDTKKGIIVEVQPDKDLLAEDYLLQRLQEAFEAKQEVTPRVGWLKIK